MSVSAWESMAFSRRSCDGLNCIPPKLHVEAPTPNVTVGGDRALSEVIKVSLNLIGLVSL